MGGEERRVRKRLITRMRRKKSRSCRSIDDTGGEGRGDGRRKERGIH